MNLVGPGGSPGYGVVEDTGMFGPGRSSGFGQVPVQADQPVCLETQDVWVMVMTSQWL